MSLSFIDSFMKFKIKATIVILLQSTLSPQLPLIWLKGTAHF